MSMSDPAEQNHLLHDRGQQVLRQEAGPEGHLPVLFLRRQDRRARPERLGQELAAADPGRRRQGIRRPDGPLPRATPSGFSSRSRSWTNPRPCAQVVEEGVQDTVRLLEEFNRINEQLAEPMSDDEMNKLLDRQGDGAGEARRPGRLGPGLAARDGHGRPALPARRHAGHGALRRRETARGPLPAAAAEAGHPASRRADQPSRCRDPWPGWSTTCSSYAGTVIAVTHDRYFLDNVAGWILELDRGQGIPWKGNYSSWLEQKQARLRIEEKVGKQPPEDPRARTGVDPHEPQGAPAPSPRRASPPTRSCWPRTARGARKTSRSTSRPDRGWATW